MSPGSCNSGLRSLPSAGAPGSRRAKGLDVSSEKDRKPTAMPPMTASTRDRTSNGNCGLNSATAAVHRQRISTHSSREPSWLPHTAENLYMAGSRLLLLEATTLTEKSSCRKAIHRHAKLIATKINRPTARLGARAMATVLRRQAPQAGNMVRISARHSALIRAKWPISGII